MFTNYSQTFAAGITALAGVIITLGRLFGWDLSENDIVFMLGAIANFGGIIWAIYHRWSKGDIKVSGLRR